MSITVPCYAITPLAYCTMLGLDIRIPVEDLVSFMDDPQMFNWKVDLPHGFQMRRISIIGVEDKKSFAFWKVLSIPLKLDPVCVHLKNETPDVSGVSSRIVESGSTFRFLLVAPETPLVFRDTSREEYVIHSRTEAAFSLELARWRREAPFAEAHLMNAERDMLTNVSYVQSSGPGALN